eukprot:GHVQ01003051.1.p1 GENE.GHVQ01003051.1~~GHVQ01003051.1.p1  ORF type:complete len:163 (+),score=8.47 GHVQ01003051.1:85-573(+)
MYIIYRERNVLSLLSCCDISQVSYIIMYIFYAVTKTSANKKRCYAVYAVQCFALLHLATLCCVTYIYIHIYGVLCCVIMCYAVLCCAMLCYIYIYMLCYAALCCAIYIHIRCALLFYDVLCCAVQCHDVLCNVIPCIMPHYVLYFPTFCVIKNKLSLHYKLQ